MNEDEIYMRRALRQAEGGRGRVSPNPLAGAVVVHAGRILGEGAHLQVGGPHAEVNALDQAGGRARGATLYCTLEPCSFHGRTPPCSQALIRAGIKRLVCAMQDPDPRVNGAGLRHLRDAGMAVEVGLLEAHARRQNAAYVKHRTTGMPLVILKLAQTLDGRIATRGGDSRWITGVKARVHAHRRRSWVDAVMVGAGTVAADDPQLNVRHVKGRDPRPMVVDGRLRLAPGARVFQHQGAVLITSSSSSPARRRTFADRGIEVWAFDAEDQVCIDLHLPLAKAAAQGVTSVMIEGGAQLAAAALRDRVVDQVMVYVAPRILGRGIGAVSNLGILKVKDTIQLEEVKTRRLGSDLLYTARVRYACSQD